MALSDVIKAGTGAPLPGDLVVGGIGIDTANKKLYIKNADLTITSPVGTAAETANTPAGGITATDVQAAINELDSDKSPAGHNHTGTYEPADGTLLKDADIGVNVQAYSATLTATTASFLLADEAKLDAILGTNTGDETKVRIDALNVDAATLDGIDSTAFGRLGVKSTWTTTQSYDVLTLTDTPTIAWNMATSPSAKVTIAANRTMGLPTNIKAGNWYSLLIRQDGTGSRTMAWNAAFKFGGNADPTLSTAANDYDLVTFYALSTSALSFVGITLNIEGA